MQPNCSTLSLHSSVSLDSGNYTRTNCITPLLITACTDADLTVLIRQLRAESGGALFCDHRQRTGAAFRPWISGKSSDANFISSQSAYRINQNDTECFFPLTRATLGVQSSSVWGCSLARLSSVMLQFDWLRFAQHGIAL